MKIVYENLRNSLRSEKVQEWTNTRKSNLQLVLVLVFTWHWGDEGRSDLSPYNNSLVKMSFRAVRGHFGGPSSLFSYEDHTKAFNSVPFSSFAAVLPFTFGT